MSAQERGNENKSIRCSIISYRGKLAQDHKTKDNASLYLRMVTRAIYLSIRTFTTEYHTVIKLTSQNFEKKYC
jgi:hypothetical protein